MQFKTTEQALNYAYKLLSVNIEPKNNTLATLEHMQGIVAKGNGLSQHEHHANAVMLIKRVESVLNAVEYAVIRCKYSADLSGIIDITAYLERENYGVNLLICDSVLSNLFTGSPRLVEIQDRYDLSKVTLWRHKVKVERVIAEIQTCALIKISDELRRAKIIALDEFQVS